MFSYILYEPDRSSFASLTTTLLEPFVPILLCPLFENKEEGQSSASPVDKHPFVAAPETLVYDLKQLRYECNEMSKCDRMENW